MSKRKPDRLGDFQRKEPVTLKSASRMAKGLRELEFASSFEGQLKLALRNLAGLAIAPLKVFELAELPHELGFYARTTEGKYIPLRTRPTPDAALADHEIDENHSSGSVSLAAIGLASFPANSKVGFAAAVLRAVESLRNDIRSAAEIGDVSALRAINLAIATVQAHHALSIEFIEGPNILLGRNQRQAGRRWGQDRSSKSLSAVSRRNAKWQAAAEEMWAKNSSLSKVQVGDRLFRLQTGEKTVSVQVIRKAIIKTGKSGSTLPKKGT